jgi:DNA-binding response OmpR family regulator
MPYPPVLMVEDDESHALLVKRVFERAGLANPVRVIRNGDEAVSYLSGEGDYADREANPVPAVLLLDVHVPGRSGLEVLWWLRGRTELKGLPVLMFSGSAESDDINRAFELGVDSYLVKPVAFDALLDAINGLGLRWAVLGRNGHDG